MALNIGVREYLPGDEGSIVEFLAAVFNGWPHFSLRCSPLEHWKWKYLDNPKKLNAIGVAEEGGEIIGCEHGYFLDVKIGEEKVLAHQGGDSAVDPRFQGGGLYSKINKFRNTLPQMRRIDYSYWATTNKKMIEFARRRNMPRFPRRLLEMARIKDLELHFRANKTEWKLPKSLGYTALRNIDKIMALKRRNVSADYSIRSIERFGDGVGSFWESIQPYYKYIVTRGVDYLNWRYCDPRSGDYHIIQAEDDDGVLGYCVYRINSYNKEYQRGDIMDLITLPGRVDVAQSLLASVLGRIDDLGVNCVSSWAVKGQSNTDALKSFGFVDVRAPLALSHRWVNGQVDESELLSSPPDVLHCQMGDVDW